MNRNSDPAPGDLHRHPLLYSSRRQPSCRSDRCASTRSTPLETTRVRWHGPTHRRRGVGERHRIHLSGSRLGPLGCPAAGGLISRTDGWVGCGERPAAHPRPPHRAGGRRPRDGLSTAAASACGPGAGVVELDLTGLSGALARAGPAGSIVRRCGTRTDCFQ